MGDGASLRLCTLPRTQKKEPSSLSFQMTDQHRPFFPLPPALQQLWGNLHTLHASPHTYHAAQTFKLLHLSCCQAGCLCSTLTVPTRPLFSTSNACRHPCSSIPSSPNPPHHQIKAVLAVPVVVTLQLINRTGVSHGPALCSSSRCSPRHQQAHGWLTATLGLV